MKDVVFVTGNEHKIKYLSRMVGYKIESFRAELPEIQSNKLRDVVEQKAKEAFKLAKRPVLVEDTGLFFNALGGLPGPFIKWFLKAAGNDGLCKMLNDFDDRSAIASAAIAYYDGKLLEVLEKELPGTISGTPRGKSGFGWNNIFIPEGTKKTLGEMSELDFELHYGRVKPFDEVATLLKTME